MTVLKYHPIILLLISEDIRMVVCMPIGGQDIVLNINRMELTWENNNNEVDLPLQGLLFKSFA